MPTDVDGYEVPDNTDEPHLYDFIKDEEAQETRSGLNEYETLGADGGGGASQAPREEMRLDPLNASYLSLQPEDLRGQSLNASKPSSPGRKSWRRLMVVLTLIGLGLAATIGYIVYKEGTSCILSLGLSAAGYCLQRPVCRVVLRYLTTRLKSTALQ